MFDVDQLRENARRVGRDGFAGVKTKVGRGHAEDARRIRAVREELPDDVALSVDANCSFDVAQARRVVDRLDVPIAFGENASHPTQFKQVLGQEAVDVLQPEVSRVGSITPWLTVAETASLRNTPVSPHYVEPIHVRLVAPFDNVPYIEHHSTVLNDVTESPLELRGGGFTPPDAPGHGMKLRGLERYQK